jgi:hypothetical protein
VLCVGDKLDVIEVKVFELVVVIVQLLVGVALDE